MNKTKHCEIINYRCIKVSAIKHKETAVIAEAIARSLAHPHALCETANKPEHNEPTIN